MHVRCLDCQGPLTAEWACPACHRRYRETLGIPDLRDRREDDESAEKLVGAFATSSFAELVALHAPSFSTDHPKLVEDYIAYRELGAERGRKFYEMVTRRVSDYGIFHKDSALIIGCGSGAVMMHAARNFRHVVGIDPCLPELILAKKAAEESGIVNLTLIQGYAQRMPFPERCFDLIVGENVLEHVFDIDGVMQECARTARGWFVADSVNRFNLLRPEPHVKLWGVGLLPRKLQGRYVLWRRDFSRYDAAVRLLSYRELRAAMRRHFSESHIIFPGMGAYGFPDRFDAVFNTLEKVPALATSVLLIFPVHLALARSMAAATLSRAVPG